MTFRIGSILVAPTSLIAALTMAVQAQAPVVTPDGDPLTVTGGAPSYTAVFTITNNRAFDENYDSYCDFTGVVSSCQIVGGDFIYVPAYSSVQVDVTFSATEGTGTVALHSLGMGGYDNGSYNVTVTAAPGPPAYPTVVVSGLNPEDVMERHLCLTMAAGAAAAAECGDLRIVHPLPSTLTLNKLRTPTLHYSSQHASPYPLVAANVTLPQNSGVADSVVATLTIAGAERARLKWAGADWLPSQARTRRIVIGYSAISDVTGIYNYTLEVANWYGASRYPTTATGQLSVVNRSSSTFGAGWWLAGLEELLPATMLWIGGDGSVRKYQPAGSNVWVAPSIDRPDTLKLEGGYYVRTLAHGVKVRFNLNGLHVETENRLGQKTTFAYDGTGKRLLTITVPPAGSGISYAFTYGAYGTSNLSQVTPPPLPGGNRNITVALNGSRTTQIDGPGGTFIKYLYGTAADSNRIVGRLNRKGDTTAFTYDVAKKLSQSRLPLGVGLGAITRNFQAFESKGFGTGAAGASVDTLKAYAKYDGPRIDTGDTTLFFLNRYSAPLKVVDALGQASTYSYGDSRWPGRVTRVQSPNGRVVKGVLDTRGLDSLVIDSIGSQAALSDTTRYEYDSKFYFVTKIVPPERDSSVLLYNQVNGNRLWQQDARGTPSRVTYSYYASGVATGMLAQIVRPLTPSPADSFAYDALGNLSRTRDPLGQVTYVYKDAIGRDTLVKSPIEGAYFLSERKTFDLFDRVTVARTEAPAVTHNDHFTVGAPTISRPAQTLIVENYYDLEGNLDSLVRSSSPDTTHIGRIKTQWLYDKASRRIVEIAPDAARDSFFYDLGGNQTNWKTRRGHNVSMSYDAANRLISRNVPGVWYPEESLNGYSFPRYTVGYTTPTDAATFQYDPVGNLIRADNVDARVIRVYNKNGTLAADTLQVRTYNGTDFSKHVYGVRYGYDRNGRRRWMKHPQVLAPRVSGIPKDSVAYAYNTFGALSEVVDVLGNRVKFFYDLNGRTDSTSYPGSVWEKRYYDLGDRMWRRLQKSPITGTDGFQNGIIHDDTLSYDARGRILTGRGARFEVHDLYYTGLGAIAVGRDGSNPTGPPSWSTTDQWWYDALGNYEYAIRTAREQSRNAYIYDPGKGRIRRTNEALGGTTGAMQDTSAYDASGNLWKLRRKNWYNDCSRYDIGCSNIPYYHTSVNYYSADNKLYVVDKRSELSDTAEYSGTFEESRYDALGRRVLRRARAECTGTDCGNFIERFVYDGDQFLYEIHFPGSDAVPSDSLERDTTRLYYNSYGRVAYTHAAGIDQPVSVIRVDYGIWALTAVFPHQNWRGQFDVGTFDDGKAKRCNGPDCVNVNWQGQNINVAYELKQQITLDGGPSGYFGSLIGNKREASGNLYMRNRYYDPHAGRFTQEDPIGLAGGVNVYGFAKGDPVNFSDPFGLCDKPKGDKGAVGICLEAFIKGKFGGLGDNRGAKSDGGSYKASIRFSIDPKTGAVSGLSKDVGSTGSMKGNGSLGVSSSSDGRGGWNVSLTGSATNGVGVGPSIDFNINLRVSGDGEVSTAGGSHDGFPSYEVWAYQGRSDPRLVYSHDQGSNWNFVRLFGNSDTKVPQ
ncbi:MAG: RHS repeat-associated core domain-containing protein [Gemmatimonadaceae bacterium]